MTDHTCTRKIGGDSIFLVVIQVERKTVMTTCLQNNIQFSLVFSSILILDTNFRCSSLLLVWIRRTYSTTITCNLGASLLSDETLRPTLFNARVRYLSAAWAWTGQWGGLKDLGTGFLQICLLNTEDTFWSNLLKATYYLDHIHCRQKSCKKNTPSNTRNTNPNMEHMHGH